MCTAIYISLIALLLLYSDFVLEQYALSVTAGDAQWTLVAIGWEIIPFIWPAIVLAMVAASAVTFLIMRKFHKPK